MKQKSIFLIIVLTLVLSACGLNPVEKLEEKAAEQIAEKIVEQATGAEDVQFDVDGDSASYSVTDEDGNTITVDANQEANLDTFTGMGFNIPLPDGLVNGTVQEVEENGEVMMVSGVFEMENVDIETFYSEIHASLIAAGFTYFDMMGGEGTAPDPTDPNFVPLSSYTHEDGYQFSIMGDESGIILGLVRASE